MLHRNPLLRSDDFEDWRRFYFASNDDDDGGDDGGGGRGDDGGGGGDDGAADDGAPADDSGPDPGTEPGDGQTATADPGGAPGAADPGGAPGGGDSTDASIGLDTATPDSSGRMSETAASAAAGLEAGPGDRFAGVDTGGIGTSQRGVGGAGSATAADAAMGGDSRFTDPTGGDPTGGGQTPEGGLGAPDAGGPGPTGVGPDATGGAQDPSAYGGIDPSSLGARDVSSLPGGWSVDARGNVVDESGRIQQYASRDAPGTPSGAPRGPQSEAAASAALGTDARFRAPSTGGGPGPGFGGASSAEMLAGISSNVQAALGDAPPAPDQPTFDQMWNALPGANTPPGRPVPGTAPGGWGDPSGMPGTPPSVPAPTRDWRDIISGALGNAFSTPAQAGDLQAAGPPAANLVVGQGAQAGMFDATPSPYNLNIPGSAGPVQGQQNPGGLPAWSASAAGGPSDWATVVPSYDANANMDPAALQAANMQAWTGAGPPAPTHMPGSADAGVISAGAPRMPGSLSSGLIGAPNRADMQSTRDLGGVASSGTPAGWQASTGSIQAGDYNFDPANPNVAPDAALTAQQQGGVTVSDWSAPPATAPPDTIGPYPAAWAGGGAIPGTPAIGSLANYPAGGTFPDVNAVSGQVGPEYDQPQAPVPA